MNVPLIIGEGVEVQPTEVVKAQVQYKNETKEDEFTVVESAVQTVLSNDFGATLGSQ